MIELLQTLMGGWPEGLQFVVITVVKIAAILLPLLLGVA